MAAPVFAVLSLASDRGNTEDASPIFGVTIPKGYRQWELIAPSQEAAPLKELRAILTAGTNELARCFRQVKAWPSLWRYPPCAGFEPWVLVCTTSRY